jgi:hypothetical protein
MFQDLLNSPGILRIHGHPVRKAKFFHLSLTRAGGSAHSLIGDRQRSQPQIIGAFFPYDPFLKACHIIGCEQQIRMAVAKSKVIRLSRLGVR